MIKTRQALDYDMPWLLKELQKFAKFYSDKVNLFGKQDASEEYIKSVMDNHLLLVAEEKNDRLGLIAGLVIKHPFNDKVNLLQELWWWVPEEHRCKKAGSLLFKDFCEFGEKYCNMTVFTLEHKSPVPEEFLTNKGFERKEITYVKESSWQQ